MSTEKAAQIFVHYITLAFEKFGEGLNADCRRELADAAEAFRQVDDLTAKE